MRAGWGRGVGRIEVWSSSLTGAGKGRNGRVEGGRSVIRNDYFEKPPCTPGRFVLLAKRNVNF